MAYDEDLAARVRGVLSDREDVLERKMFGGIAFMVSGSMCCGIVGDDLMVRVGPDRYDEAVSHPHVRPMDFTGRPLKGMIYVAAAGLRSQRELGRWVSEGVAFVEQVPASRRAPAKKKRASAVKSQAPGGRAAAPAAKKPAAKKRAAKAAQRPAGKRARA